MNKFIDLQERWIGVAHKFNILEIGLFESYLMVAGFLIAVIFPSILSLNIFVYLIIFLLWIAFVLKEYITKNKNIEKRWKMKGWHVHLLRDFSYLDFAIYKTTIVVFGILLVKIFPALLNMEFVVWYTLIFGIGLGYFIAKIFNKEKKGFFK